MRVAAAHGEGMEVVVLEAVPLRALATGLVSIATAAPVTLEHRSPHGCGDVARRRSDVPNGRGRVPNGRRILSARRRGAGSPQTGRRVAWRAGTSVAPSLEPLESLSHGPIDDSAQIGIGQLRAQQGLKPLEL
ncbi:MAG: hypothetical protein ACHP85_15665, partial [Burkholderiales bacterium]